MTQHSLATDRRGWWVPTVPLIGAKLLDLRRRRTLMIVTVVFTVVLPVVFYAIRLLIHLSNTKHYGPAGSPSAFAVVVTLMDEFGFIVAATLGATAGTDDLSEGMFRHLVITGRSRLALYLARVPAGLAILLSLAATGFTMACLVTGFLHNPLPAGAVSPPAGSMTAAGLWLELDMIIAFTVGLGLGSLMGQRTVPVILLIVLEIIITPALATHSIPGFIDGQRLFVGVAMDQLKPAVLHGGIQIGPSQGPQNLAIPPMPTWALASVIAGWAVIWSALGAWRMNTRDT